MRHLTLSVRPAWVDAQGLPGVADARETLLREYARLDFEPGPHIYTDPLTGFHPACVSDVVETWCAFDEQKKSMNIFLRDYNRRGAKYYHMTQQDILDAWHAKADAASAKGTILHSFAEACFCVVTGRPEDVEPEWASRLSDDGKSITALTVEEMGIFDAWNWMPDHLVPVVKECRLYNDELGYAGTLDLLCYDRLIGAHVLPDWKTNETLDKGHFEHMKPPFGHLWDTSLSHYILQQSHYQIRLEDLGFRVASRYLLHVDACGIFTPVKIEAYTKVIRKILAERKAAGLTADGKPMVPAVETRTEKAN